MFVTEGYRKNHSEIKFLKSFAFLNKKLRLYTTRLKLPYPNELENYSINKLKL
jgi:hypothetical protein